MLDECSGDKFWEVCVGFSAVVVRKRVVRKKDKMGFGRPVAQTLGAAQGLSKTDREAVLPLLVAHRVSLARTLKEKQRIGEEFAQLGDVLREKEVDLESRKQVVQAAGEKDLVEQQLDHFRPLEDALRKGWVGDEGFEEAILAGGRAASSDRMLAESTEALFSRDRRSRVSILGQDEVDLTEDIVSKAKGQNTRLKRWQALYDRLQAAKPKPSQEDEARAASRTINTRFNRHADLTLGDARSQRAGSASPTKTSHTRAASACVAGYDNILSAMREDLRLAQNARRNENGTQNDARHGRSASAVTGANRTSSYQSSQSRQHSRSPSLQYSPSQSSAPFRPGMGRRVSSRSRSYQQPKVISQRGPIPLKTELFSPLKSARPGNESPSSGFRSRPPSTLPSPQEEMDESGVSIDGTLNHFDRFGTSRNSESRQPTPVLPPPQEELDETITSIDAALAGLGIRDTSSGAETPQDVDSGLNFALPTTSASTVDLDPPKQDPVTAGTAPTRPGFPLGRQPSLLDRTRQTMASSSSNSPRGTTSRPRSPENSPSPAIDTDQFPLPPTSPQSSTRTLAERTRQSISAHQPSTPIARRSAQHARSRTSIIPQQHQQQLSNTTPRQRGMSVDHLTPSREADEDEHGSSRRERIFTPTEKLFEANVEYDSVFKSRPKVAHSPPVMTPSVDDVSMVDALKGLDDDYDDYDEVGGSSPLRR